jgi:hypothetical protein
MYNGLNANSLYVRLYEDDTSIVNKYLSVDNVCRPLISFKSINYNNRLYKINIYPLDTVENNEIILNKDTVDLLNVDKDSIIGKTLKLSYNLINKERSIEFKVTDSGLKSVYVEKDQMTENQNIISIMSKESIPLQFKIDPVNKTITRHFGNHITLYWELKEEHAPQVIEVFRMTLRGPNGDFKDEVVGEAHDKGNFQKFNKTMRYNIGDTLTIWHYTPSRVSIKGNVIGAREDYSDGVDNEANLTETAFKLTANGLEAIYKDAHKVTGVKDTKIALVTATDVNSMKNIIEQNL